MWWAGLQRGADTLQPPDRPCLDTKHACIGPAPFILPSIGKTEAQAGTHQTIPFDVRSLALCPALTGGLTPDDGLDTCEDNVVIAVSVLQIGAEQGHPGCRTGCQAGTGRYWKVG